MLEMLSHKIDLLIFFIYILFNLLKINERLENILSI